MGENLRAAISALSPHTQGQIISRNADEVLSQITTERQHTLPGRGNDQSSRVQKVPLKLMLNEEEKWSAIYAVQLTHLNNELTNFPRHQESQQFKHNYLGSHILIFLF